MEEMKRKIIDGVTVRGGRRGRAGGREGEGRRRVWNRVRQHGAVFESESGIRRRERSVHDWRAVCVRRRDVGRVAKGNGRRGKGGSLMRLITCKREKRSRTQRR